MVVPTVAVMAPGQVTESGAWPTLSVSWVVIFSSNWSTRDPRQARPWATSASSRVRRRRALGQSAAARTSWRSPSGPLLYQGEVQGLLDTR